MIFLVCSTIFPATSTKFDELNQFIARHYNCQQATPSPRHALLLSTLLPPLALILAFPNKLYIHISSLEVGERFYGAKLEGKGFGLGRFWGNRSQFLGSGSALNLYQPLFLDYKYSFPPLQVKSLVYRYKRRELSPRSAQKRPWSRSFSFKKRRVSGL